MVLITGFNLFTGFLQFLPSYNEDSKNILNYEIKLNLISLSSEVKVYGSGMKLKYLLIKLA